MEYNYVYYTIVTDFYTPPYTTITLSYMQTSMTSIGSF